MKRHNAFEPADAPPPGIYRHYKGSLYQVLGMARHSENEEWLVVYQALYGERGFWLRPLTLWLEQVSPTAAGRIADGSESMERFSLIEPKAVSLSSVIEPC